MLNESEGGKKLGKKINSKKDFLISNAFTFSVAGDERGLL